MNRRDSCTESRMRNPAGGPPFPVQRECRPTRQERLRATLPATVALLLGHQSDKIETGFIEDYVALHWLEWHGGSLHLTIAGKKVCALLASTYAWAAR